jgi:hypothetical protein
VGRYQAPVYNRERGNPISPLLLAHSYPAAGMQQLHQGSAPLLGFGWAFHAITGVPRW